MEGVGEEEWVVTKDKEKGINIHILLFQKKKKWASHITIEAYF